jgi:hypothetical protein
VNASLQLTVNLQKENPAGAGGVFRYT